MSRLFLGLSPTHQVQLLRKTHRQVVQYVHIAGYRPFIITFSLLACYLDNIMKHKGLSVFTVRLLMLLGPAQTVF